MQDNGRLVLLSYPERVIQIVRLKGVGAAKELTGSWGIKTWVADAILWLWQRLAFGCVRQACRRCCGYVP